MNNLVCVRSGRVASERTAPGDDSARFTVRYDLKTYPTDVNIARNFGELKFLSLSRSIDVMLDNVIRKYAVSQPSLLIFRDHRGLRVLEFRRDSP